MTEVRCAGCGKKLLTYDNTSIRRYKSPLRKCKKCGREYADPRCHEIAIEGLPADTFSVKAYLIMLLFGGFLLYRGNYMRGMVQLGVSEELQWMMPTVIFIFGLVCVIGGIVEIITIAVGIKAKKYDRLRLESEQRLRDRAYAKALRDLGYPVPETYLQGDEKNE